jgi:hypothetical protein
MFERAVPVQDAVIILTSAVLGLTNAVLVLAAIGQTVVE